MIMITHVNISFSQNHFDGFSISSKAGLRGGLRDNGGIAMGLSFNLFKKNKVYTLGYNKIEEITLFGSPNPNEDFHTIDFMYGEFIGNQYFRLQYQVGLSTLWGIARGERKQPELDYKTVNFNLLEFSSEQYERKEFITIGVPLGVGFKITPVDFMSIALDLNMNINLISTTFTSLICLEFGWLNRQKKNK